MGMFDYLAVDHPEVPKSVEWQTKDTPAQWCDRYEIRADGSLWHQNYDTEDQSDPNAVGIMRLAGCMTSVNHRWEPCNMTGEIVFYTEIDKVWHEYSAYFVDGKLQQLHQLEGGKP